uniref:Uncharacterized protein n=1 Tax=Aliivibrio wodanis TaxID=80852 RepID=A0A5Q4ZVM7_9GAMM|nr:hypothetical protein AW0309160_03848 [Aliivibrio wodanis]
MSASIKNISRYYQARYQSRFEYPDPDWEELATSSGIAQPRNPKIRYFSPNYPLPYYGRKNGTLRRKLQR